MKSIFLAAILVSFCPVICQSQITGDLIANHCASDSGATSTQYLSYGNDLAKTLSLLTPAQLKRVFGKNTTVALPDTLNEQLELGDINFGQGSANLSPEALIELDKVVEYLVLNDEAKIRIEGHVRYDYGGAQQLSENRAAAAMDYLVSMGISSDRIESVGLGATEQLVEGGRNTPGNEVNRRIEIHVEE